jgi:hypothetical protein
VLPPNDLAPPSNGALKWASLVLFLAAAYNVVWGSLACAFPERMLAWYGVTTDRPELWQCIGMLVGVYGIGYWFASRNPHALWPLVLVGLLGKLLGPLGSAAAVSHGRLPAQFLWLNAINDLIWLPAFVGVLLLVHATPNPSTPTRNVGAATLYERVLGAKYAGLSPELRRFHSARDPIQVHGAFQVVRGSSRLGNWLTDLSGFPRTCSALPVSLTVRQLPNGERWTRLFGDRTLESWQGQVLGLFAERFGPLTLYLDADVRDGALVVWDLRSTMLGLPLPPFLSPRVYAWGRDGDGGISVHIRITNPILGPLIEYSGIIAIGTPAAPARGDLPATPATVEAS